MKPSPAAFSRVKSGSELQRGRRHFLADMGMGFTGLALGSLLAR